MIETPPEIVGTDTTSKEIELDAGEQLQLCFDLAVNERVSEGYYAVRLRLDADQLSLVTETAYLPVFGSIASAIDGREIAKAGHRCRLAVSARNLADRRLNLEASVDTGSADRSLALEPDSEATAISDLGADSAAHKSPDLVIARSLPSTRSRLRLIRASLRAWRLAVLLRNPAPAVTVDCRGVLRKNPRLIYP